LGCSEIPPHIGKHHVLWHAFAIDVHKPEVVLGSRMAHSAIWQHHSENPPKL
jgi:hypothetical protein